MKEERLEEIGREAGRKRARTPWPSRDRGTSNHHPPSDLSASLASPTTRFFNQAFLGPSPISANSENAPSPMASSAQLRLMSDLKAIHDEPPEGCSASPYSDENLFLWTATIFGPEDTPWEGGIFSLHLVFGDNYPEKPPKVRFTSDVYHPNVYSDGTLCMDIIQDAWSPCHSVSTILTSIQSLLTDPNPTSPANPEAARLYQTDIKAYNRKVRQCARRSLES